MDYMDKYNMWLNSPHIDDMTKEQLKDIKGKSKIEDMFYRDLELGTGGLRGIMGPGTNRMNVYVVRKATQGLANYIKKQNDTVRLRGVVIAYDSRYHSREFAMETCGVLAGNGIKSYVFDDLRPTPELSYAVRKLSAIAGIVITASHNPAQYNGYKIYWEDGAQISKKLSDDIMSEINSVTDFNNVMYKNLDTAKDDGLLAVIGTEIDSMYLDAIKSLVLDSEAIEKVSDNYKIIYTPLHGTGNIPVRKSLENSGFKNVFTVKEQELPDPKFPTVKSPNPEDPNAFLLALKLAEEIKPDIILGTDPDCDRLGISIPDDKGNYINLTGNQIGALLVDYMLSRLKDKNKLPDNGVIIKTIVTSELGRDIASSYGIRTIDTLTGFKYIGDKINEYEHFSSYTFLFGYEESYGFLAGTFVRDKDAVIASTLACEMGAYYKSTGMSIYQALSNIYKKYGYYSEALKYISLDGKEGSKLTGKVMSNLRLRPPAKLGIENVVDVIDYQNGVGDLPASDVLQFITDKRSRVSIRPSGTEPRLKIYYSASGKNADDVSKRLDSLISSCAAIVERLMRN